MCATVFAMSLRETSVVFSLLLLFSSVPAFCQEQEKEYETVDRTSLLSERTPIPESSWKQIGSSDKRQIVTMLNDHLRSNYELIRTWRGLYRVRSAEAQTDEFLASSLGDKINGRDLSHVETVRQVSLEFVIDMKGGRVFRDSMTDIMYWRDTMSGEKFTVPDTTTVSERSFVTGEEYVHFDPKAIWPEFDHLLDNPDAQNKRAAFRKPAKNAQNKHYGDMMDPRAFFGYTDGPAMSLVLTFLLENDVVSDDRLQVFAAQSGEDALYKIDWSVPGGTRDAADVHASWVFDGAMGFQVTAFSQRQGGENMQEKKWRWKSFDNIFIPEVVFEIYRPVGSQRMKLWRESELLECSVNFPLDSNQFTFTGIGLEEGELIVDSIERAVKIFRDGDAVKLGAYGDQYVPSPPQKSSISMKLIGANVVAVLLVLAWLLRGRTRNVRS